jgi:hypothetical protein
MTVAVRRLSETPVLFRHGGVLVKPTGLRIRTVLAVIALVAVDCAWLRRIVTGGGSALGLGQGDLAVNDLAVSGMLTILGLGLLASRGRRRSFLIGFEVAGVAAIVVYVGCCWLFPGWFALDLVSIGITQRIHDSFMGHLPTWTPEFDRNSLYPPFILAPLILIYTVVLTLPLLVVAIAGGVLSRRLATMADA